MSIDLLKIGRVVMSFLFSRIWVVTTLVLLSGCAASLEQLQIMDKSAGFNKTIVSKTRITLLGEILDKNVKEAPKQVQLKFPKLKKIGETNGVELPKLKLPKLNKV